MTKTEAVLRRQIDQKLRTATSDLEWEFLVRDGYINDILDRDASITNAVNRVKEIRKIMGGSAGGVHRARSSHPDGEPVPAKQERPTDPVDTTEGEREALAVLLAQDAAGRPDVRNFRKDILGGKLLAPPEVAHWIKEQVARQGYPRGNITIPAPETSPQPTQDGQVSTQLILSYGYNPFSKVETSSLEEIESPTKQITVPLTSLLVGKFEHLSYYAPGDDGVHQVPTNAGSVLDGLRNISEHIAEQYNWDPGEATVFVLAGEIPATPAIVGVKRSGVPFGSQARITLTIDPSASPEDVADYYRQIRHNRGRRQRSMKRKNIELAKFVANRPAGEKLSQTMRRWNSQFAGDGWGYQNVTNFGRDWTRVRRHLLRGFS